MIPINATDTEMLEVAERAFTTRRVPAGAMRVLIRNAKPRAGDLVLARVTEINQHKRLHRPDGSRRTLFTGDLVIVVYGDRYASDQFEAFVPGDLRICDLVASGGVAARVQEKHRNIRRATRIVPIGLVANAPESPPLNVAGWALPPAPQAFARTVPVLSVVGSAMNSGKTTSAAHLIHGLSRHGLRVGYGKVTGTGAAGDPSLIRDAGAHAVLDFTDMGYVSTYRLPLEVIESIGTDLVHHLQSEEVDVIVLEIADGLYQAETAELLVSERFSQVSPRLLYCCGDSLSAAAGIDWLRERELPLVGVAGVLTNSPLQVRETQAARSIEIFDLPALGDPATAAKLIGAGEAL